MRSTWISMNKPSPIAEVTLEDPETTLRIVMEDEVGLGGVTGWWGSVPGHIGTVEIVEGQTLQFQSDGTQETWCKIYHQICPRVVSRKQGAFPRILIYQRRESSETIGVGRVRCCVHRPGFRWSVCSQCSVCLFHSVLCRGFWMKVDLLGFMKVLGPNTPPQTVTWGRCDLQAEEELWNWATQLHSTKPQMKHLQQVLQLGGILQNITCLYDAMKIPSFSFFFFLNLMTKVIVFPKDREGSLSCFSQ